VLPDLAKEVEEALNRPLGRPPFEELVEGIAPGRVAIAVPDETRPTPVKEILPVLLKRLYSVMPKLQPSAVTVIIGGGLHPPLDAQGRDRVVSHDVAPGCRVISHDAKQDRMFDLGVTSRGTPVKINAEFCEAHLKMAIGQIDPHQFVGFTGGAKGVVIGCAAAETIEHNHSLMFDDQAQVGRLENNPVRQDMNEAGRMVGIDLVVNVLLDANKNGVQVLAGEPVSVLEEGSQTCAALYGVSIREEFDIVIASCGGYPKDICLYQSQKGLNLASQAVKKGGKILLLAACPQGVGDDIYFDYVYQFATPQEVLEDFKRLGFKMGAHKAYLFGRTLIHYDVAVFSDLDPGILKRCHLRAADPAMVIEEWVEGFEGRPRVAVVPDANTTYFYGE
jgi:nickel-dependent lactate racemase